MPGGMAPRRMSLRQYVQGWDSAAQAESVNPDCKRLAARLLRPPPGEMEGSAYQTLVWTEHLALAIVLAVRLLK